MKVVSNFIVPIAKEKVCSGFGFGAWVVGGCFPPFFLLELSLESGTGVSGSTQLLLKNQIKSMEQAGALKNIEFHRFPFFQRHHLTFKINIKFPFNLKV